ncbi:unnamed protein product [Tetraodon nigroviridis]|uniref:(spotted green pufferfish) hypothetical protein n=1 Tax=Tetraodon nigroviridis TaxID=99883 RepID=Q4S126_TETNG|nr:unnamed protein product [Tetraodon nigroviridis]
MNYEKVVITTELCGDILHHVWIPAWRNRDPMLELVLQIQSCPFSTGASVAHPEDELERLTKKMLFDMDHPPSEEYFDRFVHSLRYFGGNHLHITEVALSKLLLKIAFRCVITRQLKARVWSCSTGGSRKQQSKLTWRGENDGTAHKLWLLAVHWLVVKLIIVFVVNHWLTRCSECCGSRVFLLLLCQFSGNFSLKKFPLFDQIKTYSKWCFLCNMTYFTRVK